MAKKRNSAPDSTIAAGGAVLGREHRNRARKPSPAAPSSGTAVEGAGAATELRTEAPNHTPESAEVARLAYSYWESRGRQGGSAQEDWLRAEHELRTLRTVPARA